MINKKRVLDEFFALVSIRCSTLDEREMGNLLTARLRELGAAEIHEDNAGEILGGNCGNIVANFKGSVSGVPTVMLTAHMDCVEPCAGIRPQLVDGVIRSDGTTILGADDKAGVVAILETLRCLREQHIPHGDLQIVFTVAEEGGVNGSQNIDQSLLQADVGFTLDTHGHPGMAAFKAPGKNQIEVAVRGKASHAGVDPDAGRNAIIAAGRITGGTATNVVAEFCTINFESRSRDKAKLDALTARMVEIAERTAKEANCTATVTVKKDYDPYELPQDALAIRYLHRAAGALGFPVILEEEGGGSDANFFNAYGIPTTVLGVGMTDCHTKEECRRTHPRDRTAGGAQILKKLP